MYLPIPLADGSTDSDVPDTSLLSAHEREAIDLVLSLDRPSREGERMRSVLGGLAQGFDSMRRMGTIGEDEEEEEVAASSNANGSETKDIIDGASARVSELLLTLRDVIDSRVDYARAFVALGGSKDQTGSISTEKLCDVVKDFGLTIDIEKLIHDIDKDGSGQVDYEEFKALLA